MMMAKDPLARYKNCKDLILDLKAVKEGKTPPLAHKDFKGADLAGLAQAEAAAPADLAVDQETTRRGQAIRPWLFWTLVALLVISAAVNVYFLANRSG
jgi:hypothetical protein